MSGMRWPPPQLQQQHRRLLQEYLGLPGSRSAASKDLQSWVLRNPLNLQLQQQVRQQQWQLWG